MEKKKHRHKFTPIEIAWISVWDKLDAGKPPLPNHLVLACRCGAIKLVPAKIVSGGQKVVQAHKEKTK